MLKRGWLPALLTAVFVVVGTGCGDECIDNFDCRDKGTPSAGKEWTCVANKCEQTTIQQPPAEDAGTDAGVVDAGTDAGVTDAGTDAGVRDAGTDAGTDAGVTCSPACGTGEFCDTTSGTGVCRTCNATQGCTAPLFCDTAANNGKGVCKACEDTVEGNGQDQGCAAGAPVCDTTAGNGVGACKVCFSSGTGQVTGCAAGTPICDATVGNGAGQCKVCLDSETGATQDQGCSPASKLCDTSVGSGIGECKSCIVKDDCPGSQTCNTAGLCEGCADNASCTTPETPVCRTTPTPSVCVECTSADNARCDAVRPVCNGSNFCGCTSDTNCSDVPNSSRDFCDTASNGGRGQCEECLTSANCGDANKPVCDAKVCVCLSNTDCALTQVCNGTTKACEASGPTAADASAQIEAFRAAAPATEGPLASPVTIDGAFVTFKKPTVAGSTELPGFFLQALADGPAMFVTDATALGQVAVGDRVTLTVTAGTTTTGVKTATAVSTLTVSSQGHPVQNLSTATPAGLKVNRSTEDLTVAGTADKIESELITLTGTIGDLQGSGSSGTGFAAINITTAGVGTANANFRLRAPNALVTDLEFEKGCKFTLNTAPAWRFNANVQPSVFEASQLVLSGCPAPKLLRAVATTNTTVDIFFSRQLDPASVQLADFVVPNLQVSSFVVSGTKVTLTTAAQPPGQAYDLTVNDVTDKLGTAIDAAAHTTQFFGFAPAPAVGSLVINEIDYDQPGTDGTEFVEIYNRGTDPAYLSGLQIVLVNGGETATPKRPYLVLSLTSVKDAGGNAVNILPPGGYLVVGATAALTSTTKPLPSSALRQVAKTAADAETNIIQNGPDGIGLMYFPAGTMIDSLFYGTGTNLVTDFVVATGTGDVTLTFGEGAKSTAVDTSTAAGTSLQRTPNGADTNDNNADFKLTTNSSPGAANL